MSSSSLSPAPQASSNRRTSSRPTKTPGKFQPATTSNAKGNGKRKRARDEDDAAEDEEQLEGEEDLEAEPSSDENEEASADEEELKATTKKAKKPPVARKPPQKKQPATKKARTNATSTTTNDNVQQVSSPPVRVPSRPKKVKKVPIADKEATGLYADVFTSGVHPDATAVAWMKEFEADNAIGLIHIVNLVLRSAGCDQEVTEDDVNDPDNASGRLNDLQEDEKGRNVAAEYPLIRKGGHVFKDALVGFFDSLLRTISEAGLLYDEIALIENLHLWVTTMSSSTLRPFRHTATVVSLSLATALCRVATEQETRSTTTSRQLEALKKSKVTNKGRMQELQKNINQYNDRAEFCRNTIMDFFDTVFVHRYRDVDAKIRAECVEALGSWMTLLPDVYYDGQYLRYFGWLLSDSVAIVRQEVLKQLQRAIQHKNDFAKMRHFVERFRLRIIEIAQQDSDVHIRAAAVSFLDSIREAGMLEPDDIDTVGKLIFDSEARVRKAVASFFAANIDDMYDATIADLGGIEALEEIVSEDTDEYETPRLAWIKLKCVSQVLLDYDRATYEESSSQLVHNTTEQDALHVTSAETRFSLATQALHETVQELRDWDVIAGYLLFDHSEKPTKQTTQDLQEKLRTAFAIVDDEEVILLEVLYASARADLPSETHSKKKTKDSAKVQDIARRLAIMVPQLLKKFAANPSTTSAVLRLEQLLDLKVFQDLRQESTTYAALLKDITNQFSSHSDVTVLSEASAALLHAKSYDNLEDITESRLQSLWKETLTDLCQRFPQSKEVTIRGDLSAESLEGLGHTVSRIAKLASISDPTTGFDTVYKSRQSSSSGRANLTATDMLLECSGRGELPNVDPDIDDLEDRIVTYANKACLFYFMWKARQLQSSIRAGEEIADDTVDDLRNKQERFSAALVSTFSSRGDIDELRLMATGSYIDLQVLNTTVISAVLTHNKANNEDDDRYTQLHELTAPTPSEVTKEVTDIFAQIERKYARKTKKTLEAPGIDDEPEDSEDDEEDDEESPTTDANAAQHKAIQLNSERQLCDLTGKLVLGLLAGVLDQDGQNKGKLRARLLRNKTRLGVNFKEIVRYLEDKKGGAKKSRRVSTAGEKKAAKAVNGKGAEKKMKSKARIEESDEEEDEEEEVVEEEIEDPFAEDLVRADEGNEDDEQQRVDVEDEDDVMGD